jgi:hypothetical protein
MILIPSDFTGKHKIGLNDFSQLAAYITKYEPLYLMNLLGIELYQDFKEDIDEATRQPQSEEFKKIFEPLHYDLNGTQQLSEGIAEMLKGFIYFEYVRDVKFKATDGGIFVNNSTESRQAAFTEFNIYGFYNDSIRNYKAIRTYIKNNLELYPKFNGVDKQICHWVL